MKKLILIFIALSLMTLLFTACGEKKSKRNFVTIGTGGVTGVYYPTGGAISKMLNNGNYNIKATVESTGGSVYNINAVLTGDLDFGIAQSDRQYQAYKGLAEWEEKGKQTDLRSIFSIHPESITLVASEKSGIKSAKDLIGKRVNLGNVGSGQLQNSKDIFDAFSIKEESVNAEYVKAVEAPGLIQDERIDAFFYTLGHPSGAIKEATSGRVKVRIVALEGEEISKMIEKYPYYAESIIEIKNYPNAVNTEDIVSVGVKATLITSAKVKDDIVYAMTKEVFENLDEFKKLHPAYSILTKESMLKGLSAPIHKGALKYYREVGLDKFIKKDLIID